MQKKGLSLETLVAGVHTTPDTETYVAQGRHLMLTLTGCPSSLLDDEAALLDITQRAVAATDAQVLNVSSHHFEPQGVTILILLAESHASIHTYPEEGIAFWDCFTCGWRCDPERSTAVLVEALQPTSYQADCLVRGEA
jgi:S-adenosylmethionine decarboxylase proenzyme